jgi:hypothetical protein
MNQEEKVGNAPLDRLIEEVPDPGQEPPTNWATELVRSADPFVVPPGSKRRVQLALEHRRPARARAPLLRPALVAAILLSGGAIASAALTHWPATIIRHYQRVGQRPIPTTAITERVASRTSLPPAPATVPEPAPAPTPISSSVITRQMARSSGGSPDPVRSTRTTAPWHGEDPSLVAEAMRALRLAHDPVRARTLAATYLERHPHGALAEEALAISIQAALEHRDPDARQLGADYLKSHPTGQLRWLAERALASGAASSR